jgi:uncharacterized membrane protein
MRFVATTICLWIAVIAVGIGIGGNVFQMMVIDPVWSASPPESVRTFSSGTSFVPRLKRFHTNPFFLIGLVCLIASPFLAWNVPAMRTWLLIAAVIYVAIALTTVLYVWRLNDVLFIRAGEGIDAATVTATVHRWLLADRIRFVFKLASFLCLLRAMSVSAFRR